MNRFFRRALLLLAAMACICGHDSLHAQIANIINADAQAYFGDANDTFKAANPISIPIWGGFAGLGPYAVTGVPTVPAPPALPLFPATLPNSNSFAASPYISGFANVTNSVSAIGAFGPGGNAVSDATVQTKFNFNNPSLQYAYHQWNFEVDYNVTGPLAGGIGSTPPLFVSGSTVGATSYAQFAGVIEYWFLPVNTAGIVSGPWANLGSVSYNWTAIGPGTYSNVPVFPTGALAATTSGGYLSLIGELYVAGDPAFITVVPEPSTMVLGGFVVVGFMVAAIRRKRTLSANIG